MTTSAPNLENDLKHDLLNQPESLKVPKDALKIELQLMASVKEQQAIRKQAIQEIVRDGRISEVTMMRMQRFTLDNGHYPFKDLADKDSIVPRNGYAPTFPKPAADEDSLDAGGYVVFDAAHEISDK